MSIPALDGTVECNKFLCFNLFDIDRKKKLLIYYIHSSGSHVKESLLKRQQMGQIQYHYVFGFQEVQPSAEN